MAIEKENKSFFYQFNLKNVEIENVDYRRIVSSNQEGKTMLGKQKLFEFFMIHPDSYRKICSFIKLKQNIADKYVPITNKDLCLFTRIKKDNLLKVIFYLSRKIHLLKGNWDEYRIPEYLWNTDILDIIKNSQKEKICGTNKRKCVRFLKNSTD